MNTCLCCDRPLLRHILHGQTYWYCAHCRQAMPYADHAAKYASLRQPIGLPSRQLTTGQPGQ